MVAKKRLFGQAEMSYFEYLRRYISSGVETRLRYVNFLYLMRLLTEGEFLLSALSEQRKRSTPAYRKLYRRQARLRTKLLIESEPSKFWTTAPEETVKETVEEESPPEAPTKKKNLNWNEGDELTAA